MSWLKKLMPGSGIRTEAGVERKRSVPEGLWEKCERCGAVLYRPELEENLEVCPKCAFHMPIRARARLAALTLGDNFCPHGTAEYLRPHIRRTQAGGAVEAKGALDVIQLQGWLADLQACLLGRKIHLHYRCLPGSQGNIQFQPAT